mgnify:CR=1 FL=1
MINKDQKFKILVIHGPNMNLIGHRYKKNKSRVTLDKINRYLRKEAIKLKQELIIVQTNDEGRAVTILQRKRNKIHGILLFPGPWQQSGYVLKDTLELLAIPYVTVSVGEKVEVLDGIENVREKDLLKACKTSLTILSLS